MLDKDQHLFKRKWLRLALRIVVAVGALLIFLQAASTLLAALNLGKG